MRDEYDGLFIAEQKGLQLLNRSYIQVVGGFIKQEHVRVIHQGSGKKYPPFHACRQGFELRVFIKPGPGDYGFYIQVIMPCARGFEPVLDMFKLPDIIVAAVYGDICSEIVVFLQKFNMN